MNRTFPIGHKAWQISTSHPLKSYPKECFMKWNGGKTTKTVTYQRIVSYCFPGGCWVWTKFSRLNETILRRSICSEEECSFEISSVLTFNKVVTLFSESSAWSLSWSLEAFTGLFPVDFNLTVFLRFQYASSTRSSTLSRKNQFFFYWYYPIGKFKSWVYTYTTTTCC